MACFHPITGWRDRSGAVKFNAPGLVTDVNSIQVACGQCGGCRLERARQWAIRCMHEAKFHQVNSFITLTYDDEHLPEDGSLKLRDWQQFADKLRADLRYKRKKARARVARLLIRFRSVT